MDGDRFDALARALAAPGGSRRRLLGGLAAVAAALLGGLRTEDAAAHDALARCRRIADRRKRRRCIREAEAHKHGVGGACADRDDCTTAFCPDGTCRACTQFSACGSDAEGACFCQALAGVCIKSGPASKAASCQGCPAGTTCQGISANEVGCHWPCGSVNYCPAGADACKAPATCGNGGQCFQPLGGEPTRCGKVPDAGACGCGSNKGCADRFGTGAFCVKITGAACTCGAGGADTFCVLPR